MKETPPKTKAEMVDWLLTSEEYWKPNISAIARDLNMPHTTVWDQWLRTKKNYRVKITKREEGFL